MTFTRHGHHINGTKYDKNKKPTSIARCGGPMLCRLCGEDAAYALADIEHKKEVKKHA